MTMTNALNPRILQPGDIDPNWRWDKHIPAWGHPSVDFEKRVDHDRLRRYRLSRAKDALKTLLESRPEFSLSYMRDNYHIRIPEAVEHFIDGLRKAGMPE